MNAMPGDPSRVLIEQLVKPLEFFQLSGYGIQYVVDIQLVESRTSQTISLLVLYKGDIDKMVGTKARYPVTCLAIFELQGAGLELRLQGRLRRQRAPPCDHPPLGRRWRRLAHEHGRVAAVPKGGPGQGAQAQGCHAPEFKPFPKEPEQDEPGQRGPDHAMTRLHTGLVPNKLTHSMPQNLAWYCHFGRSDAARYNAATRAGGGAKHR